MFSRGIEREYQSEMGSRREQRGLYLHLIISFYNMHTSLCAGSSLHPRMKIIMALKLVSLYQL